MPVAPPRPKSLPLTALRAFEAAGRLGGFAAAAAELGVTPGAVAAQIKALERAVDAPLFERSARGALAAPFERRAPIDSALRLWAARPGKPSDGAARVLRLLQAGA